MKCAIFVLFAVCSIQSVFGEDIYERSARVSQACEAEYEANTVLAYDDKEFCELKCLSDGIGLTDAQGNIDTDVLEQYAGSTLTAEQKTAVKKCQDDAKKANACTKKPCREVSLSVNCAFKAVQ